MVDSKTNVLKFPAGRRLEANGLFSQFRNEIESGNLNKASEALSKLFEVDQSKAISAATHFKMAVDEDQKFWSELRELQLMIEAGTTSEVSDLLAKLFCIEGPDLILAISNMRKWIE